MNHASFIGNLTRDIELSYTQSGFAIGKLSVAVNDKKKKGEQWEDVVHFLDVTLLGTTATGLAPFLMKGKKVGISAKIQQDRWVDKNSGAKRSKIIFLASTVDLLSPKEQGQGQGYSGYQGAPQAQPNNGPSGGPPPQAMPNTNVIPGAAPPPAGPQQQGFSNMPPAGPPQGPPPTDFEDDIPF